MACWPARFRLTKVCRNSQRSTASGLARPPFPVCGCAPRLLRAAMLLPLPTTMFGAQEKLRRLVLREALEESEQLDPDLAAAGQQKLCLQLRARCGACVGKAGGWIGRGAHLREPDVRMTGCGCLHRGLTGGDGDEGVLHRVWCAPAGCLARGFAWWCGTSRR